MKKPKPEEEKTETVPEEKTEEPAKKTSY